MKEFLITEVELKRYSVLREVTEKRLTLKDATRLLAISYRHAILFTSPLHFPHLKRRFPNRSTRATYPSSVSTTSVTQWAFIPRLFLI